MNLSAIDQWMLAVCRRDGDQRLDVGDGRLDVTIEVVTSAEQGVDGLVTAPQRDDVGRVRCGHVEPGAQRGLQLAGDPETAEVLDVSTRTVEREWRFIRSWLRTELSE